VLKALPRTSDNHHNMGNCFGQNLTEGTHSAVPHKPSKKWQETRLKRPSRRNSRSIDISSHIADSVYAACASDAQNPRPGIGLRRTTTNYPWASGGRSSASNGLIGRPLGG
ncbi:unnamed protein product, partial [Mycena citricolor]